MGETFRLEEAQRCGLIHARVVRRPFDGRGTLSRRGRCGGHARSFQRPLSLSLSLSRVILLVPKGTKRDLEDRCEKDDGLGPPVAPRGRVGRRRTCTHLLGTPLRFQSPSLGRLLRVRTSRARAGKTEAFPTTPVYTHPLSNTNGICHGLLDAEAYLERRSATYPRATGARRAFRESTRNYGIRFQSHFGLWRVKFSRA